LFFFNNICYKKNAKKFINIFEGGKKKMMPEHVAVWNSCLEIIKDNIPSVSFKTWFLPIKPLKLSNKVLTIQVPSPFFYEYLEEQYIDILRSTLKKELGTGAKLEYNVVMDKERPDKQSYTVAYPEKSKSVPGNKPFPMPMSIGNDKSIRNPFVIPGLQKLHVDPQLNSEYTFGNFIEGECNRLVRSAGIAVSSKPGGTAFNPLFIYGNSGLGKTHLAQAIGIQVKEQYPQKIVLYVTSNKFITQFTEATRKNNQNDFIHFYQMIDVLIIDDVQEFAGKEKTQNTFFHIFNHLQQSGKQLILTSDKPPVELKGLNQRLLSRFKWGLAAELQTPDFNTRLAILRHKIYKEGLSIPDDVINFVAQHVKNNVRELEGSLISLLAQSTLNKKEITLDLAKNLIDKLVVNTKKELSIEKIQQTVCNHFNLQIAVLQSKTRKREIVQARQIAMYFSKNMTKSSLAAIGSLIGGKDHATVLHACKTVINLLETDKKFKREVVEIERKLFIA